MGDLRQGRLLGYGRMPWSEASELLREFSAMWADLDGWHVSGRAVPTERPITTHMWAWDRGTDRWARVRLDGESVIVGVLLGDGSTSTDPSELHIEQVSYTVANGVPWGDDRQIPPRGNAIRNLEFEVASIAGVHPMTFARLTTES